MNTIKWAKTQIEKHSDEQQLLKFSKCNKFMIVQIKHWDLDWGRRTNVVNGKFTLYAFNALTSDFDKLVDEFDTITEAKKGAEAVDTNLMGAIEMVDSAIGYDVGRIKAELDKIQDQVSQGKLTDSNEKLTNMINNLAASLDRRNNCLK
jgi:hypothetical protein